MAFSIVVVVVLSICYLSMQGWATVAAVREVRRRCTKWFLSCKSQSRREQTRESALQDLERSLATVPQIGLLRRLGIAAPLGGVLLTSMCLMWGVDAGQLFGGPATSDQAIEFHWNFYALAPLLSGVFCGALLAVVNQGLMALVGWAEDRIMHTAIAGVASDWFRSDGSYFSAIEARLVGASDALSRSLDTLSAASGTMDEVLSRQSAACLDITARLSFSGERLEAAIVKPGRDLAEATQALLEAAGLSKEAISRAAGDIGGAARRLHENSQAVHSAGEALVQSHLGAAKRLSDAASVVSEAVNQFPMAEMQALRASTETVVSASRSASDALKQFRDTTGTSTHGVREFGESASGLSEAASASLASLQSTTSTLEQVCRQVSKEAAEVQSASQSLRAEFRLAVEAFRSAAQSIQEAANRPRRGFFG